MVTPLAIDVRGLTKRFGEKVAVDHIDVAVPQGQVWGFLGPNGSGKTTTIRMLCGLLRADAGTGTCVGLDFRTQAEAVKHQVGYMTQKFSFWEDLSIRENLEFVARIYGLSDRRTQVESTLERLGLVERQYQLAGQLSGGWKQRMALAACLLHGPKLLLLDEPTAGVDPEARRDFWEQIHALSDQGLTVLVSTHYMDEAERCDRIVYILNGKMVAGGTVQEVIALSGLITFVVGGKDVRRLADTLRSQPGAEHVTFFGALLHVSGHDRACGTCRLHHGESGGRLHLLHDCQKPAAGDADDHVFSAALDPAVRICLPLYGNAFVGTSHRAGPARHALHAHRARCLAQGQRLARGLARSMATARVHCRCGSDLPAALPPHPGLREIRHEITEWWTDFGSTELTRLIEEASSNNLDIAAAAARVLQADAQARISKAPLFPSLSAQGAGSRTRTASFGSGTGPNAAGGGSGATTANSFGLSLNASYQLDVWGRARDAASSANQQALSSRYAKQLVALTVTTNVADTYLATLELRQRLVIARQNVDVARRTLDTVRAKLSHGTATQLDIEQQQTLLANAEATVPALEEQEHESRYTLAILLGRVPEEFDVQGDSVDGIQPPLVAPGLPSDLLSRRPDVAEAEANLASAHADVDSARAAFLPQIGLTGSGGSTSSTLSHLLTNPASGWGVGANVVQTIFDGGALNGQLALSRGRQQELIATYRQAVLNAFSDVETNLGQVSSLAEQEQYRSAQSRAAAEAFRLAELQYRRGVTDLLNVLTAQQAMFTARDQLVQFKLSRLQTDVGLYQALGGGWK